MILFESVKVDFSFLFLLNELVDEVHVDIPISSFLARFIELDKHIFGLGVFLNRE